MKGLTLRLFNVQLGQPQLISRAIPPDTDRSGFRRSRRLPQGSLMNCAWYNRGVKGVLSKHPFVSGSWYCGSTAAQSK